MANDEERLIVALEARIRDFEKNMLKAERTGTQSFTRLRRGSQTATQQMEQDAIRASTRINQAFATVGTKIGAFGKSFSTNLLGTVAGLGIAGIVGSLREVAGGVAAIGDEAKRAGVDVKAFQELKFVAEQNRIGVDALTDGLKEMNLRADEFILTGKGSSAEAFQRLGLDSETLAKKLKDPSALFTEIIGKLGQFDKAAQIRIADEIFGGTGGEKFVQLIGQGEAGIHDTIKAANDLGIVMDEQLIARAAEVDRKFNTIASTVGSTLKSAIVSAADSLMEFIDGFRDFQNQMGSTLQSKQADLGMRRVDLENQRLAVGDSEPMTLRKIDEQLRQLAEEEAKVVEVLNNRITPMQRSGKDSWTPPDPSKFSSSSAKGSSSSSSSSSSASRERDAVAALIAELEEELRLVDATDEAKRAAQATREAGAAATDAEREKIVSLTQAIHAEEEARQRTIDQMHFYQDITKDVLSDIRSAMDDGKITWQEWGDIALNVLNKVIGRIEDDLVSALFDAGKAGSGISAGSGGGSGLIGAAFKGIGAFFGMPAFAGGTNFAPGGPAVVGERGPEIVNLPRGSSVTPNHAIGISGPTKVDVAVTIDWAEGSNGNLEPFVARVSQKTVEAAAPGIVSASVRRANDSVMPTVARHQQDKSGGDYRNG